MDERLLHLKESMDRTVLKNGEFRPDEKQKILQTIRIQNLKRKRRRRRWGAGFAVAVSLCLLFGVGWFIFAQLQDQPKFSASKSSLKMDVLDANKNKKALDNSADTVHPFDKNDIERFKTMPKRDNGPDVQAAPHYTYVVLNNFYYKETGEMVSKDKLGQEIGRIKRAGDLPSDQPRNSNGIPPGAIYAIHGEDPAIYVAAKGSIARNGKMETGYLIFKRFEPVKR